MMKALSRPPHGFLPARGFGLSSDAQSKVPASPHDWFLAFLIGLAFCGYPAASFLAVPLGVLGEGSRSLTVPYRTAVLGLSVILFRVAWQKRRVSIMGKTQNIFLAFWFVYLLRLTYESYVNPDDLPMGFVDLWAYALGVCICSNLALLQPLSFAVNRLAPWFLWGLALSAILAGVILKGGQIDLRQRLEVTELLNPISYGQCAVTLILMSGYLALRARSKVIVLVLLMGAMPGFYTFAAAGSRSPILSLLAGLVVLLFCGYKSGANWKVLGGLLAAMVLVPLALSTLIGSESALTTRVADSLDDARGGVELDRFFLWRAAWAQFLEGPVLGRGLTIAGIGYPHNLAVEALMTTGVIGGGLFFWLEMQLLRNASKLLLRLESAWMPLLAVQFFVLSMFSGALYSSPEFWAIVMLQVGAVSMRPQK